MLCSVWSTLFSYNYILVVEYVILCRDRRLQKSLENSKPTNFKNTRTKWPNGFDVVFFRVFQCELVPVDYVFGMVVDVMKTAIINWLGGKSGFRTFSMHWYSHPFFALLNYFISFFRNFSSEPPTSTQPLTFKVFFDFEPTTFFPVRCITMRSEVYTNVYCAAEYRRISTTIWICSVQTF